jgi:hypothetical protein
MTPLRAIQLRWAEVRARLEGASRRVGSITVESGSITASGASAERDATREGELGENGSRVCVLYLCIAREQRAKMSEVFGCSV